MFFTHGGPSEGQEPCGEAERYLELNIEILAIAVGEDAAQSIRYCNLSIPVISADDFVTSTETLTQLFQFHSCAKFAEYTVNTPFNGDFSSRN